MMATKYAIAIKTTTYKEKQPILFMHDLDTGGMKGQFH